MADSHSERPDRNLALELVRTTEAAALAAAHRSHFRPSVVRLIWPAMALASV